MTGRDEPSAEELRCHLERRIEGLEKRFNRHGMPLRGSPTRTNDQKPTGSHALIDHSDNNGLNGGGQAKSAGTGSAA